MGVRSQNPTFVYLPHPPHVGLGACRGSASLLCVGEIEEETSRLCKANDVCVERSVGIGGIPKPMPVVDGSREAERARRPTPQSTFQPSTSSPHTLTTIVTAWNDAQREHDPHLGCS